MGIVDSLATALLIIPALLLGIFVKGATSELFRLLFVGDAGCNNEDHDHGPIWFHLLLQVVLILLPLAVLIYYGSMAITLILRMTS